MAGTRTVGLAVAARLVSVVALASAEELRIGQELIPAKRVVYREVKGPAKYGRLEIPLNHRVWEYYRLDGKLVKRAIDASPPHGKIDMADFFSDGRLVVREIMNHPRPPKTRAGLGNPDISGTFRREVYEDGRCVYVETNSAVKAGELVRDERITGATFLGGPDGLYEILAFGGEHGRASRWVCRHWQEPEDTAIYAEEDRNSDGRVDWIAAYEDGIFSTTTSHVDNDFDGKADIGTLRYYEDKNAPGIVTRVEEDRNLDGRADRILTYETYEDSNPRTTTIWTDEDFDGIVDTRRVDHYEEERRPGKVTGVESGPVKEGEQPVLKLMPGAEVMREPALLLRKLEGVGSPEPSPPGVRAAGVCRWELLGLAAIGGAVLGAAGVWLLLRRRIA